MKELERPFVTAVVATRDRPQSVAKAAEAILANDYPNFELIVVDQGSGNRQTTSLKKYLDDPRFHLTISEREGVSPARNTGIAQGQGKIVAITDDDCEVPSYWLLQLVNAFSKAGQIGIVFGNVLPANHDSSAGFIPAYVRENPIIVSNIYEKHQADGIGACMGLRKTVWQDLGGFDEMFGVGAPLKSNSEGDFTMRALKRGYSVYETPSVEVVHRGFRTWEEGSLLIPRYWFGTGAMYAKHFKMSPCISTRLLSSLGWRWAFGKSRVAASLGPDTHKVLRLRSFIKGFAAGMATPVDHATGHLAKRGL